MNEIIEIETKKVEDMIYEIRGKQVILDSDLAKLFGYETKDLNRNVKNNITRFPPDYCFQLEYEEYESLRFKNFTLKNKRGQHRKYLPYVFTEHGITMLAGILKSEIAIKVSLRIVDSFIKMRKYISKDNYEKRISNIETKLIDYDNKFDEIFNKFDKKIDNHIFFKDKYMMHIHYLWIY